MKLLVVIPAFNEQAVIADVVVDVAATNPQADILVVNDASWDGTAARAEQTGRCFVLTLPVNLGIGGAVQTGFLYAQRGGYDCVVQCDGDGQHPGAFIQDLCAPLYAGTADVVVGSRYLVGSKGFRSTGARRFGTLVLAWIGNLLTGIMISDATSGFRAYNRSAIAFLARNYPSDYPEPEAVVMLARHSFSILEVSVNMCARKCGASSISRVKALYYMLKVSLAMIVTAMRSREHE